MTIKLIRYKDGSYTPLSNPFVRRIDFGTSTPKTKETPTQRYKRQKKEGTYKKNWVDKLVDRILD
jgi:hypothetical protein